MESRCGVELMSTGWTMANCRRREAAIQGLKRREAEMKVAFEKEKGARV